MANRCKIEFAFRDEVYGANYLVRVGGTEYQAMKAYCDWQRCAINKPEDADEDPAYAGAFLSVEGIKGGCFHFPEFENEARFFGFLAHEAEHAKNKVFLCSGAQRTEHDEPEAYYVEFLVESIINGLAGSLRRQPIKKSATPYGPFKVPVHGKKK